MKNNMKMNIIINTILQLEGHKNVSNIMNAIFIYIPNFKPGKLISWGKFLLKWYKRLALGLLFQFSLFKKLFFMFGNKCNTHVWTCAWICQILQRPDFFLHTAIQSVNCLSELLSVNGQELGFCTKNSLGIWVRFFSFISELLINSCLNGGQKQKLLWTSVGASAAQLLD